MHIILNPKYSFRSDDRRIIIFDSIKDDGWLSFIHPLHAIILSYIGMLEDISEAKLHLYHKFGIPQAVCDSFISKLLDNKEPTYVKYGEVNIAFPPETIITSTEFSKRNFESIINECIDMNDVDLTTKRLYSGPDKIVFMLTNKCAVKCNYCYADTYTKCNELSYSEFCNIITECKSIGVRRIELIGGDIFIKQNWDKYISFLIKNQFNIDFLSTKKTLNASIIDKLLELKYSGFLQISLDSIDPIISKRLLNTTCDYINQIKESFDLLSNYPYLPFKVRISTVLCSANSTYESIYRLFNFIKKYDFISRWEIGFAMQPFKPGNIQLCSNTQEYSAREIIENIKTSHDHKFEIMLGLKGIDKSPKGLLCLDKAANYRCSANINSCFILPDGKVTLCERLYWNPNFIIGDLKINSLLNIWQSPQALFLAKLEKSIDNTSPCFSCIGKKECYGKNKRCFVNVISRHGTNSISYPDPSCIKSLSV